MSWWDSRQASKGPQLTVQPRVNPTIHPSGIHHEQRHSELVRSPLSLSLSTPSLTPFFVRFSGKGALRVAKVRSTRSLSFPFSFLFVHPTSLFGRNLIYLLLCLFLAGTDVIFRTIRRGTLILRFVSSLQSHPTVLFPF